ncbi:MAG: PH domain-containing protein [Acidobacteria bacterium]|nr:PH domain-containing protein [Acidobacteriota bacterium]
MTSETDHRLDPRSVTLQREIGWYVTAGMSVAFIIGLILLFGFRRWYWWAPVWTLGSIGLAWLSYRWAEIEYRHTSYRVDGDGIEITSGVYWRQVCNVPRSRVQHTDVAQGPLERKHGLGRLVIYTAGTAHSKVMLPGLEHHTALTIRDHLLPRESADAV